MTILVTSAAGSVGRKLIRRLVDDGADVRALVKNKTQADVVAGDGVTDVVVGDLRNSDDLRSALRGATRIYHAAPTQIVDEMPIAQAIIDIGNQTGLEHIVFHSVIHPEISELPHHVQKGRVEDLLLGAATPVTVLRPSHYMQNYLEFREFISAGIMPYPVSPDSVMGVVDVDDVADAAARVLASPEAHSGAVYDLSAQQLNRYEMAEIWGEVLGHRVTAIRLPPQVLVRPALAAPVLARGSIRALVATGVAGLPHLARGVGKSWNARGVRNWPESAQQTYVTMMAYYDVHGLPPGNWDDLPKLLGRCPTTYEQFVRREARI